MDSPQPDARGHQSFEHTADVGVMAWGRSPGDLFEEAAAGLIEVLLDPAGVHEREARPIRAEGATKEDLLYGWLDEVLFALNADGFAPARAQVRALREGRVEGAVLGEPLDKGRHALRSEVKAVTYHDLHIEERDGLYSVRVVFDV